MDALREAFTEDVGVLENRAEKDPVRLGDTVTVPDTECVVLLVVVGLNEDVRETVLDIEDRIERVCETVVVGLCEALCVREDEDEMDADLVGPDRREEVAFVVEETETERERVGLTDAVCERETMDDAVDDKDGRCDIDERTDIEEESDCLLVMEDDGLNVDVFVPVDDRVDEEVPVGERVALDVIDLDDVEDAVFEEDVVRVPVGVAEVDLLSRLEELKIGELLTE